MTTGEQQPERFTADGFAWALEDFLCFLSTWTKTPTTSPKMEAWDLIPWLQDHFWIPDDALYPRGPKSVLALSVHLGYIPVQPHRGLPFLTVYSDDQLEAAFAAWTSSSYKQPDIAPSAGVGGVEDAPVDAWKLLEPGIMPGASDQGDWDF